MSTLRAMVRLPWVSGVPEDVTVNTWHFTSTSTPSSSAERNSIFLGLDAFYQAIDTFLGGGLLAGTGTVTFYDLADAEPRAPLEVISLTPLAMGTSALPPEVSLCLSFEGARVSGEPPARRRGRVFLGPLADSVDVPSTGRPSTTAVDGISNAGGALLADSNASANYAWVVYSRTDNAARNVVTGWCDDEFDTMRSRGRERTTRNLFP